VFSRKSSLLLLCLLDLVGLLIVGLWPLTTHRRNEVNWLINGDGLQFATYGSILSSSSVSWPIAISPEFTIEFWLQPADVNASSTIIAFYEHGARHLSIRQAGRELVVLRGPTRIPNQTGPYIDIENVFRSNQPSLITITSSPDATLVYMNGDLVRQTSSFPLTRSDVSGSLVFANDPLQNDSWSGVLKGLALYEQLLSAENVGQHYRAWTEMSDPEVLRRGNPLAVYLFSERQGDFVRNQAGSGPDLKIPPDYFVLHASLLAPIWREFSNTPAFWRDVLINVAGFIPWGLLVCAFLIHSHTSARAAMLAVLTGFLLSLFIESLQSFLPTRDSSTTDVLTNTLGTLIGALSWNAFLTNVPPHKH
jgi:VanZ like family/Concanavalin A-like lectin/glucanases superfamily